MGDTWLFEIEGFRPPFTDTSFPCAYDMNACVGVYAHVHMCACGRPQLTLVSFYWVRVSPWTWKLQVLVSLCWGQFPSVHAGITGRSHASWSYYLGSEIWTLVLMLAWQVPYPPSHLPFAEVMVETSRRKLFRAILYLLSAWECVLYREIVKHIGITLQGRVP